MSDIHLRWKHEEVIEKENLCDRYDPGCTVHCDQYFINFFLHDPVFGTVKHETDGADCTYDDG